MLLYYLNERDCDKKQFLKNIRQMIKKKVVTDNLLKRFVFFHTKQTRDLHALLQWSESLLLKGELEAAVGERIA